MGFAGMLALNEIIRLKPGFHLSVSLVAFEILSTINVQSKIFLSLKTLQLTAAFSFGNRLFSQSFMKLRLGSHVMILH